MKYIIFANNNKINYNNASISSLVTLHDTVIITLNHGLLLPKILETKNCVVWHFCRRSFNKTIPYSGLDILDTYKKEFTKIFLYPHPNSIGNVETKNYVKKYIKNHTSFEPNDFSHMPGFNDSDNVKDARFFLSQRYNKITNLSMGLISYLHIQNIKTVNDKVYLVGFTHEMNENKHNPQAEKDFFLQEQDHGRCYKIEPK